MAITIPPISGITTPELSGNMTLDALMLAVMSERAQLLDGQVRNQVDQVRQKNDILKQANHWMAEARKLQNAAGTGCSTMPANMKAFFSAHGIKWDTKGSDDLHNKDEWGINIENLKGFTESLTSTSQLDMAQLQSLMGKYNQTFEQLSNFISKYAQSLGSIAGNLR
jgi:hypothetical protein